jgi:succinoglycan biosynthesis protein ExoV
MAIYFHDHYSKRRGFRNFGDDINQVLLDRLFSHFIIDSKSVCLVGIGTILNDQTIDTISHYEHKVVFSTGAGYGPLTRKLDDSWEFVCVRGPATAHVLHLPPEKAMCDGAILLADFHKPKPSAERDGTVFIPHVDTNWGSGTGLRRICDNLGMIYLSPSASFDTFIETVRSSSLVISEAMHGVILADALRTPWIPIDFLYHENFKWKDWFASIELPYACHTIRPRFWNLPDGKFHSAIKMPYTRLKQYLAQRVILDIWRHGQPLLSRDEIMQRRKASLRDCVEHINSKYGETRHGVEG